MGNCINDITINTQYTASKQASKQAIMTII